MTSDRPFKHQEQQQARRLHFALLFGLGLVVAHNAESRHAAAEKGGGERSTKDGRHRNNEVASTRAHARTPEQEFTDDADKPKGHAKVGEAPRVKVRVGNHLAGLRVGEADTADLRVDVRPHHRLPKQGIHNTPGKRKREN